MASVEICQLRAEVSRRKEELIAAERTVGLAEDDLKLLHNTKDWQQTCLPTDTPETCWQRTVAVPGNTAIFAAAKAQREAAEQLLSCKTEDALRPELSLTASVGGIKLAAKRLKPHIVPVLPQKKRLEAEQIKFAAGRATTFDVLTAQEV